MSSGFCSHKSQRQKNHCWPFLQALLYIFFLFSVMKCWCLKSFHHWILIKTKNKHLRALLKKRKKDQAQGHGLIYHPGGGCHASLMVCQWKTSPWPTFKLTVWDLFLTGHTEGNSTGVQVKSGEKVRILQVGMGLSVPEGLKDQADEEHPELQSGICQQVPFGLGFKWLCYRSGAVW